MQNKLSLVRQSKISRILEMLQTQGNVSLSEAAKALYGSKQRTTQEKVIRLLSVYRKRGKVNLRVRKGQIISSRQNE